MRRGRLDINSLSAKHLRWPLVILGFSRNPCAPQEQYRVSWGVRLGNEEIKTSKEKPFYHQMGMEDSGKETCCDQEADGMGWHYSQDGQWLSTLWKALPPFHGYFNIYFLASHRGHSCSRSVLPYILLYLLPLSAKS